MSHDWKAEIDSQSRFITTEDGRRITRWRCDCCGAEDAELDWDSSEILGRPAAYCAGGCDGSDDEVVIAYHDEPCFTAEQWGTVMNRVVELLDAPRIASIRTVAVPKGYRTPRAWAPHRCISLRTAIRVAREARREARWARAHRSDDVPF